MEYSDFEKEIKTLYEGIWSEPSKIKRQGRNKRLGFHYGYYEEGIKTIGEAMQNIQYISNKNISNYINTEFILATSQYNF